MSRRVAYTKYASERDKVRELTGSLERLQERHDEVTARMRLMEQNANTSVAELRALVDRQDAQIDVLKSDRDRLTTVVEVLSRRIVSPHAETDPRRAGWRAGQRAMDAPLAQLNQKAESRG